MKEYTLKTQSSLEAFTAATEMIWKGLKARKRVLLRGGLLLNQDGKLREVNSLVIGLQMK